MLLGLLPVLLFFVVSVKAKTSGTNEFYISVTAFVVYSLLFLFSILRFLPRNKLDWDWDLEDDPTNTFEMRRRLQYGSWGRQYFNILVFPLFKLFMIIWSTSYEEKENQVNVIVIAIAFGAFLIYLIVVRPFDHLIYNILAIVLHTCAAIIFGLAVSGKFTSSLATYGAFPILTFIGIEILTTIVIVAFTWKMKPQGKVKPLPSGLSNQGNNVLVTSPDMEPTFRVLGSAPMQPQVSKVPQGPMINGLPAHNRRLTNVPMNRTPLKQQTGLIANNRAPPGVPQRQGIRAATVARPQNFPQQIRPNPQNARNTMIMNRPAQGPRTLGPIQPRQIRP